MKEFKEKVLETVKQILENLGGEMLYLVVKPIVSLATPELERILEEKPEDVYKWLTTVKEKINEALAIYESGK
jgi:succinate dehydrogenase flavin-adding protein (antitoxin of CptAB toxin-antitoxin module)